MAFPRLTRLGFWLTVASVVGMVAAFFCATETGLTLWLARLRRSRCRRAQRTQFRRHDNRLPRQGHDVAAPARHSLGLAHQRHPQPSHFLDAARRLRTAPRRSLGRHTFLCARMQQTIASPIVTWQRLFWFFTQAQVYVADHPVLRHRHASHRDIRAQARLRPSRRSSALCAASASAASGSGASTPSPSASIPIHRSFSRCSRSRSAFQLRFC